MSALVLVLILAVAQGIAEFLPISSSGHLLVLGNWFGFDAEENMTLNVVLHAGTLLAIVVFYFKKLLSILLESGRRRLILLVIAGSIPAGVVGVGLKISGIDNVLFSSPWVAAAGFVITATLLLTVFGAPWKNNHAEDGNIAVEQMSFAQALLIGCSQAIAITPGISRSGSTISVGVLSKLRKADAAEFSFLLAIPVIGGAALLELKDMLQEGASAYSRSDILLYAAGFAASAVVGYAALTGLLAMLKRGKLGFFACYLYLAAVIVAVVQIIKLI